MATNIVFTQFFRNIRFCTVCFILQSFPTAIPADRLMQNDINAGHARSSDPLSDKFSQITVNGNVAQNPARRLSNILITNRETKEKCEVRFFVSNI